MIQKILISEFPSLREAYHWLTANTYGRCVIASKLEICRCHLGSDGMIRITCGLEGVPCQLAASWAAARQCLLQCGNGLVTVSERNSTHEGQPFDIEESGTQNLR